MRDEARRDERRDGLTGIYNRKFLEAKLTEELDRARRYGRAFSVIMIDIDHFKKVNDSYGHSSATRC